MFSIKDRLTFFPNLCLLRNFPAGAGIADNNGSDQFSNMASGPAPKSACSRRRSRSSSNQIAFSCHVRPATNRIACWNLLLTFILQLTNERTEALVAANSRRETALFNETKVSMTPRGKRQLFVAEKVPFQRKVMLILSFLSYIKSTLRRKY